jgi:hypothetical protein
MGLTLNPFTGKFDIVGSSSGGVGATGATGPAGSPAAITPGTVDNAIVRANGTTNNAIQGSSINIDDATTSTQANVAITNQHAGQTNSALVLTPKGTGALIAGQKPNGIATGGNARGSNSVDLQTFRVLATEVASGNESVISGGTNNTASGFRSIVSGGNGNIASGDYSVISGGLDNRSTEFRSVVSGGSENYANGEFSVVSGGGANFATGNTSVISGGGGNTSSGFQSVVSGGGNNIASGISSVVSGGESNTASGTDSVVSGGANNTASGNQSVVGGGVSNTASSIESTISGGFSNTASGADSVVSGGGNNIASNDNSVVSGGYSNTASGASSVIAGGFTNTASAECSVVSGGQYSLADRYGMRAHSVGQFAAQGDAQHALFVLRCKTTTNTAVEMALDGSLAYLNIPSGKVMAMNINISGVRSDGSAVAHYLRQYAVKNVAGTSSQVYAPVTIGTDNAAGTSIALSVNNTDDTIRIAVTGVSTQTWRWVATVDAVEIGYGT